MNRYVGIAWIAAGVWITPSSAGAQAAGRAGGVSRRRDRNRERRAMANVPSIAGAPFTADATTEFTQTLSDGIASNGASARRSPRRQGRTRSEQDVAMLGPLVGCSRDELVDPDAQYGRAAGAARFTVVTDPVEGVTYTLESG